MRAIAILWVMLFHMRVLHLPEVFYWPSRYGWMGVDLFFVLSGYLIGSQLMRPYLKGDSPSLTRFYLRRAFRILPAFLAVLALYFAVPVFREAPGLSPAWQFLTFTENFRINYFTEQAFSHFWSLCVEEHFYLVLPVLVLLLMRKPRFGKALALGLGILLFGVAIRGYIYLRLRPLGGTGEFFTRYIMDIYYPTYTRLDGLLVGVVLAGIKTFRPAWWQRCMAHGHLLLVAGVAFSGASMWLFRDRFSFSGTLLGFPLLSLGLGLLVTSSLSPLSWLSRIRGFGFIATLAYSLYLIHKEIGHLDRLYFGHVMQGGGWPPLLIFLATSFSAAALLYFTVERPFLKLRERISSRQTESAQRAAAIARS